MDVERVELRDFRLYEDLAVDLCPGLNILIGPNASGKTTVLEALSVLATGRSFRGAADPEMVREGQSSYLVAGRFRGRHGSHPVEVVFQAAAGEVPTRKVSSVDGHPLARSADIVGRVPLLSFSPDDLALVKGGPAERRHYLDLLLAQTQPAYRGSLARYQRTLAQRNALLAELGAKRTAPAGAATLLEPWDEALAAESAVVQSSRASAVREVGPAADRAFATLDGRELALDYQPAPFDPARQGEELRRGLSLTGAHRDELLLLVAGREARRFASQGQQRSLVLALKLAALEVLEAAVGDKPVLLLDDVLSELDPRRGALLLPLLRHGQVLVTTTDRDGLGRALAAVAASPSETAWYEVGGGTVTATPPRPGGEGGNR